MTVSEDAVTLLECTIQQLLDMTGLHCEYTELDNQATFRTVLSKLASFILDGAVNKADADFLRFINTRFGQAISTHFL